MAASSEPQWLKSSYSGGSGTECVECAQVDAGVLIRDSKHRSGAVLTVSDDAWRDLIGALSSEAGS